MSKEKLFSTFPPVSTEEWENVINRDLKGADYEKKLIWKTIEGLKLKPYYRAEHLENLSYLDVHPGIFPYVRSNKMTNAWDIRQDIRITDVDLTNSLAYDAVSNGVNSIGFIDHRELINNQQIFNRLIRGIELNETKINFVSGHSSPDFLAMLANFAEKGWFDKNKIEGSLDFDPLRHLNLNGRFYYDSEERTLFRINKMIEIGTQSLPKFKIVTVNGEYFSNFGGSIVQELAFTLSMGNEYLAKITEYGAKIDKIAKTMKLSFAVGSDYFLEIAKFRAARMLWAKIVENYKPENPECTKIFIHAETTRFNKTVYDYNVNILRGTTEAMAAAIGGANSITVVPYDAVFNTPGDFSLRIARNVQLILKEESHFDKVVDPGAGSYYIENLTDNLASEAWKLFLEVEKKGGYIEAFKAGFIQDQIENTVKTRKMNIANRKEILLGTNQYPNFSEKFNSTMHLTGMYKGDKEVTGQWARPLKVTRGAKEFEVIRMKTEKKAKTPSVFLFTIGNVTFRQARAQFAANFFGCAGFNTIDNNGFSSVDEGIKACLASKSEITVICSSDDEYATIAPEIFEKIGKNTIVVVAGAPACMEDLKAAGLKHFIHVKSNVLEELKGFQELLGI